MIYTSVEANDVVSKANHKLWMSTTEVYNLRDWVKGLGLYTNHVCIEQMSEVNFEKLLKMNVTVYMEKTSCTDISEKKQMRTIDNSFTQQNYANAKLDFFWISGTNFSFHFNFTSVPDSGDVTVYLTTDDDQRRQCYDNNRPSDGIELVFPFSDHNNSFVNCTQKNGTTICESAQVVINETKHYYMCMFFSNNLPDAHADYVLRIHEVIYEASHLHRQLCHLNESHCCYDYGDIFKEAHNPTCMLITTTALGSDNIAKGMPVPLVIATDKNLEGILYPLGIVFSMIVILILFLCMFLYIWHRKEHPGHCCQCTCMCKL